MSPSLRVDVATPPRTPMYQPSPSSAADATNGRNTRNAAIGVALAIGVGRRRTSTPSTTIHHPIAPPPYDPRALTFSVLGPGGGGSLSRIVTVALAGASTVAPPVGLLIVTTTVSFGSSVSSSLTT